MLLLPWATTKPAGAGRAEKDLAPSFPASKHTCIDNKGYTMGREKFLEGKPGGKALQDSLHPREKPGHPREKLGHPRDSIEHCAGTARVWLQAAQGRGAGLPAPHGEGLSGYGPELALTGAEASAQEKTSSGAGGRQRPARQRLGRIGAQASSELNAPISSFTL